MLAKTLIAATLALAASVSAQTMPNHIAFTDPVSAPDDTSKVYIAGKNITFSWAGSCASGDWVVANPTQAAVQLVDSTHSNAVSFLEQVATIDCSGTQGNNYWVVPVDQADKGTIFSLRIQGPGTNAAYSGKFQIKSANAPATGSSGAAQPSATGSPKSAAGSLVAPILSGAAAIAAGALMFL